MVVVGGPSESMQPLDDGVVRPLPAHILPRGLQLVFKALPINPPVQTWRTEDYSSVREHL